MTGPVRHSVRVLVVTSPGARRAVRLLAGVVGLAPDGPFPHPRLSLSHTDLPARQPFGPTPRDRRGVAAAAPGPAAGIGVDLEHLRPADPRTARFFLRPYEETWLRRAPDREKRGGPEGLGGGQNEEHLRLWTVKEAVFKADLGNAARMLRDYTLDDPAARTALARAPSGARFVYTSIRRRDTILSVAAAVHPVFPAPQPFGPTPLRRSGAPMPVPAITFDTVAARLGAILSVPVHRLTPRTHLADVAADSFELVEIVVDLQEEFGVTFTQADLRPVLTLGDLVALLQGRTDAPSD